MVLQPVIPILEYEFNKDFISEVLCINKEVKKGNCEGSCHLLEQLKKATSKTDSPATQGKIQVDEYLIPFEDRSKAFHTFYFSLNNEQNSTDSFILKEHLENIISPPPRLYF